MSKRLIRPIFCIAFLLSFLNAASAQPELDISFNATGKATVDFTQGEDAAFDVLVQADNKIVAIGTTATFSSPKYFALTRFTTNGVMDTSFGDNGRVITVFNANSANEGAFAAALQPDGKIIAAGFVSRISPGEGYFALARYNPNGSLDTTFGNGGMVLTAVFQHINEARAVTVGPDGQIFAAGYYFGGNQNFQSLVARYSTNGTLEDTFGDFQGFDLGTENILRAVAIQPDGKIVTGGNFRQSYSAPSSADAKVMRFNPDGTLDSSFGASGRLIISSPTIGEAVNAVAILPDGRIIAAGYSGQDFLVMRFNANGSFDTTFGGATGRVTTPIGIDSQANSVIVRPDGKILASGSSGLNSGVVYYNADGSLDTSFSGDGKFIFPFGTLNGMAFDSLGRIVLGGTSAGMFGVARLYTLDPVPVTVTGQTVNPQGTPLRNIRVGLTGQDGQTRWAITSAFGFFVFDNVPTGQTCTLFVRGSKHYSFETRTFGLNEAVDNLTLIGNPIEPGPGGDTIVKPELRRSNDHFR
jgi:uncharacterized delta-60 repeat protein